jgi:hypothetical protein
VGALSIRKKHVVFACLFSFAVMIVVPIGTACAQDEVARPWVNKPSPRLAAKFGHWRLKFELGERAIVPDKGVFLSYSGLQETGTARIVSDLATPPPIKLTPVAELTSYRTAEFVGRNDEVVTKEILDIIRGPELAKFIATRHLGNPQADLEKTLDVVLMQDFEAALHVPKKKEHIWSIFWRVDADTVRTDPIYSAWGLFTRINGVLKPFYLAATEYHDGDSHYQVLAVGDLDGDGIDELVVRDHVFEAEEDNLEIWAWENDAPVQIHKIP